MQLLSLSKARVVSYLSLSLPLSFFCLPPCHRPSLSLLSFVRSCSLLLSLSLSLSLSASRFLQNRPRRFCKMRAEGGVTAGDVWLSKVKEYHVDGLRLDTASYIPPDFLAEVQDMLLHLARPVPIFGEVTAVNLSYHASFQSRDGRGILAGLSNFPLTYSAIPGYCGWPNAILSPIAQFDLTYLASATQEQSSMLYADTDLLMNMMDNQDEMPIAGLYHTSAGPFSPGEGGCQDDRSLLLNAWAWLMFAKGMPVVTWGDEQGNPFYRMSLWQHGWKTDTWQYKLLRRMNHIRARRQLGRTAAKVQHGSKRLFVFQRGEPNSIAGVWVFTNNLPSGSEVVYPVAPPPAPPGMHWQDILFGQLFDISEGRVAAGSRPLVLALSTEHVSS